MLSTSTCENGVNGFLKHTLAAAYAYFPSIPRLLYLFRSASSHMIVLVLADLPLWHPQLSHWDMERILSHLQAGITRTFRTPVQQTMKGPPDRWGPFLWSRGSLSSNPGAHPTDPGALYSHRGGFYKPRFTLRYIKSHDKSKHDHFNGCRLNKERSQGNHKQVTRLWGHISVN